MWSISTNILMVLANFFGIHNSILSKNIGHDRGNTSTWLTWEITNHSLASVKAPDCCKFSANTPRPALVQRCMLKLLPRWSMTGLSTKVVVVSRTTGGTKTVGCMGLCIYSCVALCTTCSPSSGTLVGINMSGSESNFTNPLIETEHLSGQQIQCLSLVSSNPTHRPISDLPSSFEPPVVWTQTLLPNSWSPMILGFIP